MDLGKVFNKLNWKAMWNALKVYGMGEKVLCGVKSLHKDANVFLN